MIFIDCNQIFLSNLIMAAKKGEKIDEELVRHMILSSIQFYNMKFRDKYGRMILCFDGRNYWRKDYFPHYKSKRKSKRDESNIPWDIIFEPFNKIKNELINVQFVPTFCLKGCESDDLIAVLVKHHSNENHMIISTDKDFIQLQYHDEIKQFSPVKKEILKINQPIKQFKEIHILKGDVDDGIPNVKSEDDSIINKDKRQGRITKKFIREFLTGERPLTKQENIYYDRNKNLIDFDYIPEYISDMILLKWKEYNSKLSMKDELKKNSTFRQYLIEKNLNKHYSNINNFF